jgi:LAO/AO transport system kinase
MDAVWAAVEAHRDKLAASGELGRKRREQQQAWLWAMLRDGLERHFLARADVRRLLPELEAAVGAGRMTATAAADRLIALLDGTSSR